MGKQGYLAVDLGAESGRVIIGVLDGHQLTLKEVHRFLHLPLELPSGLHWDLTGIWANVLEGLRKAMAEANDQNIDVVSLGVDTWGVDYALVGKSGELMGLPHCYRDERNKAAFDKVLKQLGREALYEQTGIQFIALNTLFQVVAQHDAEPSSVENAEHLLFIPDLLHYFLTGNAVVDSSIASTSQMVDPRTGDWAISMLQELGLPTGMLGKIVPPGTEVGTLLPHVAAAIGAPESLKVITPGGHDTAAAVAAVPADGSREWAYISSGTWSLMGAELDAPCTSAAAREAPLTNERGIDDTIRFLKNIAGLWLVQECRRHYEKQGIVYDYAKLTEMAAAAEPFRTLVDTDYGPFMLPGEMPDKIAEFARNTGQPEPTEVGQFVRCCLESLALTYRRVLENLERVLDRRYDVLHIVGGGGKNRLLCEMTANAIGRPVIVGPYEATGVGNILVQAKGAGNVADLAELRQIVRTSFSPETIEPTNPQDWDAANERFVKLLER